MYWSGGVVPASDAGKSATACVVQDDRAMTRPTIYAGVVFFALNERAMP